MAKARARSTRDKFIPRPMTGRKRPRGFFLGGLMSSGPASTSSMSNTGTQVNQAPWYQSYVQDLLGKATAASNTPYQAYGGEGVAGINDDQNQAFNQIRANQGNYQSGYDAAGANYGAASAINPMGAAQPALDAAAGTQSATNAAQPYLNSAGQSWTDPGVAQSYMNPYNDAVTSNIARLGNQNLMENVLPQISDVFTKSGGGFGRGTNSDFVSRAVRDSDNNILGQQSTALQQGYNASANIFGSDASRAAGLAGTAGQLASTDMNNQTNLANTTAGIAGATKAGDLAVGQAQQGLGTATQAAGQSDANALLNAGQIQQTTQQAQDTYGVNQFNEQKNWPFQMVQFLNQAQSGLQIPTDTQTSSTGSSTSTPSSGSPFGQIVGGLTSIAGIAQSDENDKTDIKELGIDPETGLRMHSYRYKGDPKSYPKVVGPMAQDIEKKYPGTVHKIGGHRVVKGHFSRTNPVLKPGFAMGGFADPAQLAAQNMQRNADFMRTLTPPAGGGDTGLGMGTNQTAAGAKIGKQKTPLDAIKNAFKMGPDASGGNLPTVEAGIQPEGVDIGSLPAVEAGIQPEAAGAGVGALDAGAGAAGAAGGAGGFGSIAELLPLLALARGGHLRRYADGGPVAAGPLPQTNGIQGLLDTFQQMHDQGLLGGPAAMLADAAPKPPPAPMPQQTDFGGSGGDGGASSGAGDYARGGFLRRYAAGGHAPIVRGVADANKREMQMIMQKRQQQMMQQARQAGGPPPGSPMPPQQQPQPSGPPMRGGPGILRRMAA